VSSTDQPNLYFDPLTLTTRKYGLESS